MIFPSQFLLIASSIAKYEHFANCVLNLLIIVFNTGIFCPESNERELYRNLISNFCVILYEFSIETCHPYKWFDSFLCIGQFKIIIDSLNFPWIRSVSARSNICHLFVPLVWLPVASSRLFKLIKCSSNDVKNIRILSNSFWELPRGGYHMEMYYPE